jgi:DNA-binding GntR family transcriptional regulator
VAAEGLVTVVPQKGARVSTPSFTEAVDLYEIRACLESLAVMRFVERASDEEISALEEAIVDFSRVAHKTTDTLALLNSKEMFYRVLIVGARSPVLEQLLAQMKARVRGLRAASLSKPGRAFETVDELDAVVRAIRDRNAELAANLCAEHVRTAAKIALRRLQDSVETDEVQYA